MKIAIGEPAWGTVRVTNQLKKPGRSGSATGVRRGWRHNLKTMKERLGAVRRLSPEVSSRLSRGRTRAADFPWPKTGAMELMMPKGNSDGRFRNNIQLTTFSVEKRRAPWVETEALRLKPEGRRPDRAGSAVLPQEQTMALFKAAMTLLLQHGLKVEDLAAVAGPDAPVIETTAPGVEDSEEPGDDPLLAEDYEELRPEDDRPSSLSAAFRAKPRDCGAVYKLPAAAPQGP